MFLTDDELFNLMLLKASTGKAVEDTATGNPVTFLTDLAKPLKSLLIPFTPIQEGSGDPSPTNVRPITGWTGVDVTHTGKNLFDKTKGKTGFVWWQGSELVGYDDFKSSEKIAVVPNSKYTLSKDATGQNQLQYFNKNGEYIGQDTSLLGYTVATITIPDNVYFVAFNIAIAALDSAQFEAGSSATSYEPYTAPNSYPVTWTSEGTVYGGYVDLVTGEVWGNRAIYTPTGEESVYIETLNSRIAFVIPTEYRTQDTIDVLCSHFKAQTAGAYCYVTTSMTVEELKTYFANNTVQIACYLASPVLITTLTPQQITALVGSNTIWSDANGDCEVTFLKKGS